MIDDWADVLECTARELLDAAGIETPPVDAFHLAARAGIAVALDASQRQRGRRKTLDGRPAVFLRPDDRPERMQWALAHELGEIHAWRVADRAWCTDALPPGMREQIANQLASRILLPGDWFFPEADRCDDDLLALKATFATASHGLIALRLLDRDRPAVVAIFDEGLPTCRKSNRPAFGSTPAPDEGAARIAVQRDRAPLERIAGGRRIRVWPIDEAGRQRDIVITTVREFADEACASV